MKPAVLHVTWLAVAAGAFFTGQALKKPGTADSGGLSAARAPGAASTLSAAERAGSLKTSAVSRDASIAEFLSRHELGSGKPLSAEKMREAMTEALRETDPVKSTMLFARLLEELTPENAAESMATLRQSISGFELMRYMPLLAYQWGSVDAKGALAAMDGGAEGNRENMFARPIVLAGLASKDPAAAQEWLAAQPQDMPGRDFYAQSIINGLAKSDPDAAVAMAAKQENGDARVRAGETIAQEKIKAGMESAASWVSSLTDPEMKRGAFEAVASQYSRTDLSKAAEYVKQYGNDPWAGNAIGDVAGNLARKDPQAGLEFAAGITGQNQARAYGETVESWMRSGEAGALAASNYVNSMPAGANRDASAAVIADEVARDDPNTAIIWGNSISDPALRQEALVDAARHLRRLDEAAYNAWLPGSGLSQEAVQQINERGRGGPPGGFPGMGGGRGRWR